MVCYLNTEKKHVHYSEREKNLLATLVRDHWTIEDKMTDAATVHNKQAKWELLTKEYNSQPETDVHRTSTQLKTWKNLKQKKRKQTTIAVNLSVKTGGRRLPKLKEDPVLETIGASAPYFDVVTTNDFDSIASLCNLPPDMTNTITAISHNQNKAKEYLNTESKLRVKRIRNLMEGDEELKRIRLKTALLEKEKA
ncbi:hypothetical protein FQA39_LY04706 [Lamprigera yunnana]|nr:hypothetical protein FQA39_LY04706 [Lamprigera yunnana]